MTSATKLGELNTSFNQQTDTSNSDTSRSSSNKSTIISTNKTTETVSKQDEAFRECSITRRKIVELLQKGVDKDVAEKCVNRILQDLRQDLQDADIKYIFNYVDDLKTKFKSRWQASHRNQSRFVSKNLTWLEKSLSFPERFFPCKRIKLSDPLPRGQPKKTYESKSESGKRAEVAVLSRQLQAEPKDKILRAVRNTFIGRGERTTSKIITTINNSSKNAKEMLSLVNKPAPELTAYSPIEALGLLLELNLTQHSYTTLRLQAKERGADIYPSYKTVQAAKINCRPSNISVTETVAKVPLSDLLVHTAKRIMELQNEVVLQHLSNSNENEATLICSWGCDGSSGQSMYKMKFSSPDFNDSSLFATTVIPLQLGTKSGHILWKNPCPQSVQFCRPLKLQFIKESVEVLQNEKKAVEAEIAALVPFEHQIDTGVSFKINFKLCLTIIDGKALSAFTNTKSSQTCPMCKSNPTSMNKLENINTEKFRAEPGTLSYGISPLHAWIRCFEFLLHLSQRLEFRKWRCSSKEHAKLMQEKKLAVQQRLKNEMGLIADVPKSGGSGTSNDGNTARRAFHDYETFSDILGVDKRLVKDLRTILITLSSQLPINADKFGNFCEDLAHFYVSLYGWFYMPVTVHKILIHGKEIVLNSCLPLGVLAEDAGESRNKIYKRDRMCHARKTSRKDTLTDVSNRAWDSSDVIISSLYLKSRANKRKRLNFPPEVLELLEQVHPPLSDNSSSFEDTEDDDFWQEILFPCENFTLDDSEMLDESEDILQDP